MQMGKNNLKDPDSAKFDDDSVGAFKENGIIKMSGIVRAKTVLMPPFPQMVC